MTWRTFGPTSASAIKKNRLALHAMYFLSPGPRAMCEAPTVSSSMHRDSPQTCLLSSQPHTQDRCDARSSLMEHGAGRWAFRMVSGFGEGPRPPPRNTSCICWLTTETPQLESHSSGLRRLHPCKKRRHHKEGKHLKPEQPSVPSCADLCQLSSQRSRGRGTEAAGRMRRRGGSPRRWARQTHLETLPVVHRDFDASDKGVRRQARLSDAAARLTAFPGSGGEGPFRVPRR